MHYLKLIITCLFISQFCDGQTKWQGQYGNKRFLIELNDKESSFTSPEFWILNTNLDTLSISRNKIFAQSETHNLVFNGEFYNERDSILADITINSNSYHVKMGKVDELQELYFPQNPRPPYPYYSEVVHVVSCDTINLFGALTTPKSEPPFPVAIIVSGTGKQDRDGTFAGHKPFFRIADYLTRRGIAVLRMDDRGTGDSSGIYEEATTRDFAKDAQACIDYLKTRNDIDSDQIGIIGHSEGGQVAFILGAESPDVAFIISLAGVGVSGLEILNLQNRAILGTMPDMTPEKVDEFMKMYTFLFETVHSIPLEVELEEPFRKSFKEWIKKRDEETLEILNLSNGREESFLGRYIWQAKTPWYRQMIQYNPELYIPKIKVPVLALNGDKDIMVPSRENLESIKRLLEKGGNKNHKVVELPGLNHMFQHCVTCTIQEVSELEEVFAEEALVIMGEWLQEILK